MLFNNFLKPGKGVNKRDPNQPRIQVFFDILPRKVWSLIKLNILYLLTSIPFFIVTMTAMGVASSLTTEVILDQLGDIGQFKYNMFFGAFLAFLFTIFIGQGPVTAGYTYIIREWGMEHPCWLISDFFKKCIENFKQAIALWIIDLIILILIVIAFNVYAKLNMTILQYIIIAIAGVYILLHIYAYQMMITFDLSLKEILKNSFLLVIVKAPVNLLIFLINVIIYIVLPIAMLVTPKMIIILLLIFVMEVLILPPITAFAINFYIQPILEKYINLENKG